MSCPADRYLARAPRKIAMNTQHSSVKAEHRKTDQSVRVVALQRHVRIFGLNILITMKNVIFSASCNRTYYMKITD
jgi:hypothetical protein